MELRGIVAKSCASHKEAHDTSLELGVSPEL